MKDVPSYGLSAAEVAAFDYFESKVGIGVVDCEDVEGWIPYTWLPNMKYILGNESLFALFLSRTHPEVCSLTLGLT